MTEHPARSGFAYSPAVLPELLHVDLVPDLFTPSFIRCMKQFTTHRGLPIKMVSDNGKTFKAAEIFLEAIISHHGVQQHVAGVGIQWVFKSQI